MLILGLVEFELTIVSHPFDLEWDIGLIGELFFGRARMMELSKVFSLIWDGVLGLLIMLSLSWGTKHEAMDCALFDFETESRTNGLIMPYLILR